MEEANKGINKNTLCLHDKFEIKCTQVMRQKLTTCKHLQIAIPFEFKRSFNFTSNT